MTKLFPKILLINLIFILSSCANDALNIIDDIDCDGQCWRGIKLGESKNEDVINTLKKMTDLKIDNIKDEKISNYDFIDEFITTDYLFKIDGGINVSLFNNEVVSITFFQINLNVESIMKKLGNPSKIFIYSTNIGEPSTYFTYYILYENLNICLYKESSLLWPFNDPRSYKIKPSTKIENIEMTIKDIPNSQLSMGCLRGIDKRLDVFTENVQEWKGYGDYIVYREGFPFSY